MFRFSQSKLLTWGVFIVGVLAAHLVICPYICSANHAVVSVTHSCCSKTSQADQQRDTQNSTNCCEQHAEAALNNSIVPSVESIETRLSLANIVIHDIYNASCFLTVLNYFTGPPIAVFDSPLYLLKSVFLI